MHVRLKNIAESLRERISDWLRALAIPMSSISLCSERQVRDIECAQVRLLAVLHMGGHNRRQAEDGPQLCRDCDVLLAPGPAGDASLRGSLTRGAKTRTSLSMYLVNVRSRP